MDVVWFDDIDDLISSISSASSDEIVRAVASEVEAILLKHIKSDIYDAYAPREGAWVGGSTYQRRHILEGNIKSTLEADGTLITTSDAPAGQSVVRGYSFSNADSGFLQLLESGHMGIWKHGFARPVVANAQREVDESPKIRAIIEGKAKRVMNS